MARKGMSEDEYYNRRSWLIDTAETPADKKRLAKDLANLKKEYMMSRNPKMVDKPAVKITGSARGVSRKPAEVAKPSASMTKSAPASKAPKMTNLPKKTAANKASMAKPSMPATKRTKTLEKKTGSNYSIIQKRK
jgi:hypothetical protein